MSRILRCLVAAAVLATAGAAAAQEAQGPPTDDQLPRTPAETRALQEKLRDMGCEPGRTDGQMGERTRKALACWRQKAATGQVTQAGEKPTTDCSRMTAQPIPCRPEWPSMMLYAQNFPPYVEKGVGDSVTGPMPQVIWTVCQRLQQNCELKLAPVWQRAREDVRQGYADGLIVILWTPDTQEFMTQSTPIARGEYGLFVRKDDPMPSQEQIDLKNLEGYRVLVYHPSGTSDSAGVLLERAKAAGINFTLERAYTSTELAMAALSGSSGRVALYSNRAVGEDMADQQRLENLRYAGRDRPLVYHVGFSSKRVSPDQVAQFDRAYLALCREGALQQYYREVELPDACPKR